MERWAGRVVLVTGASSGIGAALAEALVNHGMKVVGCARNLEALQALAWKLKSAKGELFPVKCDLKKEDEILSMFGEIKKKYGGVDVCINNAGLGLDASLTGGETAKWKEMLDINVLALCICTRESIQSMKARNVDDGHIIHISSIGGHLVAPSSSINMYTASKHAVKALTEGLRNELRYQKSNMRVTSISPGLVETDFAVRLRGKEAAKQLYSSIECLTAEDVSNAVIYALSAPQHVQVHDILMRPTQQKL